MQISKLNPATVVISARWEHLEVYWVGDLRRRSERLCKSILTGATALGAKVSVRELRKRRSEERHISG